MDNFTFSHFDKRLNAIERKLDQLITRSKAMQNEIADLEAAVEENSSVDQSAIQLLEGIAAALEAAKGDPAKVAALANNIRASSAALAAAVVANTPAEDPQA